MVGGKKGRKRKAARGGIRRDAGALKGETVGRIVSGLTRRAVIPV